MNQQSSLPSLSLSQIVSRPFQREADLVRMRAFVQAAARESGKPLFYLHPGDLSWRMNRSLTFDPRRHIHLWEAPDGELVGFAWFYSSHNGVDVQVHPGWRGRGVGPRMVRWAEQVARRELPHNGRGETLRFSAFEADRQRHRTLSRQGYRPDAFHYVHLRRSLDDLPEPPPLPEGFRFEPMRPKLAPARAALHDAAFYASAVTGASYRRVMAAPGYRAELDLLVVSPEGRPAAFALCWLDEAGRVGLFEPVGTHPDFRRLGLARALLAEGLHRLRAQGMEAAWVYTESPNLPAQKLYTALGFQVAGRAFDYVKNL